MKKFKNYIVVESYVDWTLGKGYEATPCKIRTLEKCFNSYEEAREYAKRLRKDCKQVSYGEIFYNEINNLSKSEEVLVKTFLTIKEIDTVVCKVETDTNAVYNNFLICINNFYDERVGREINERSIASFLSQNGYVVVGNGKNRQSLLLNTDHIVAVDLSDKI